MIVMLSRAFKIRILLLYIIFQLLWLCVSCKMVKELTLVIIKFKERKLISKDVGGFIMLKEGFPMLRIFHYDLPFNCIILCYQKSYFKTMCFMLENSLFTFEMPC